MINQQYLYIRSGASAPDESILIKAKEQAMSQQQSAFVTIHENLSAIVSPIMIRDKVVGTLQLHPTADSPWDEEHLVIVTAIIAQLGQMAESFYLIEDVRSQTAENLRLLDEAEERASQEQTIREITELLRGSPNLDILLETAARELTQRLGICHAVVELGLNE